MRLPLASLPPTRVCSTRGCSEANLGSLPAGMLSHEQLEALRAEAGASDVDIPPWAVAWTEQEAKLFFSSGGKEEPQLNAPAGEEAALDLTATCEKLSIQYKEESSLQGRLRRTALIGAGGTGLVYLATHEATSQLFALKRLHKARVARFGTLGAKIAYREKEAYRVFSSPFICRCFGHFQDALSLYMVLELCVYDLFQLVEEEGGHHGELPEPWTRFYAASVALGLRHIHRCGFVYRDLKLENIMVAASGNIKLTDLGSAKKMDKSRTFTAIGTEEYIPPEVLRGHGRNAASDWWGLGILVHELLMGRPPFEGREGARDREGVMDDIQAFSKQGGAARESLRGSIVDAGGGGAAFEAAADLVVSLLDEREPHRLGCNATGFQSLQDHAWFVGFDWLKLLSFELPPPYVPRSILNKDISADVPPADLVPPPTEADVQAEFDAFGPMLEPTEDGSCFDVPPMPIARPAR